MFTLPKDVDGGDASANPEVIFDYLAKSCEEFADIAQYGPHVRFIFRLEPKLKGGRRVLGACHMPRVNGELSGLFDWMLESTFGSAPDFLIILDADWWEDATPRERDILVFHEMYHIAIAVDEHGAQRFHRETGAPVWCIRGHDIEEFNAVVARYGAWSEDVQQFIAAVRQGEAK
jgi:hypothetical protein